MASKSISKRQNQTENSKSVKYVSTRKVQGNVWDISVVTILNDAFKLFEFFGEITLKCQIVINFGSQNVLKTLI